MASDEEILLELMADFEALNLDVPEVCLVPIETAPEPSMDWFELSREYEIEWQAESDEWWPNVEEEDLVPGTKEKQD
jgi:hypothetical protein